ncbi:MAG: YafY family transcriptional regulator [Christensenellaceae bacterium]|jgi:predicted DNA-binding transcriptional regulator YafY|nr:YafY family transcriptional regulator [Christensenellaceae bacterium]
MQLRRLLGIVYLLLGRGFATAAELAERFEVSKKTILRDVDLLSSAGLPIYTVQGRGGGIKLMERYSLSRVELSREEQDQILLALQGFLASQQPSAAQLSAREKLQALFRRPEADWIEIDFSRWGRQGVDSEHFEALKTAILAQRAVAFDYSGLNGPNSRRRAYPLKLTSKSFAWYLQAYCLKAQDYRSFRLSRIRGLTLLDETFERRDFQPPAIERAEMAPALWLKLRFAQGAAYRVYDEFSQDAVQREEDGSLLVEAAFSDGPWLYDYLLSLGSSVRVLEPESVRRELLARARAIQALYASEMKEF